MRSSRLLSVSISSSRQILYSASVSPRIRKFQINRPLSTSLRTMTQEYKLKGLSSLDLKPGEKKEIEVEGIDEGKVLLCNVGGKVSAIGAKCTHYGAPLVKGVLTGDGRITCPWHGACFKAWNGDIENAPAIDALPSFPLSEKNGAVYVTGKEESIKSSRRKPNLKVVGPLNSERVVVVGAGSGALATVEALRENGFKGSVTVIGNEGYPTIDRTKLSKALLDDVSKLALRDEAWFKEGSIDAIFNDEVTSVDFGGKKIITGSGKSFPYTKLVLATGGIPRTLPLPGFQDLGNIFLLRNIDHVKQINAAISGGNKKIVVIGSSFIGMEVANAVAKGNNVSVVGMEKAPLERVLGEKVGQVTQKLAEGQGVKFYLNAGVDKATPNGSDASKVGTVYLKDGTALPADVVILGIGVRPATTFLEGNSAVSLLRDGSLQTDENFSVQGLKDVYAIGDIATYPYHGPGTPDSGAPIRIEHWDVAQNAGRAVAAHIAAPSTPPKPFIPVFWSALGKQLRYCGNTVNGFDDIVLQGEPDEGKFVAYYTKGETVVAVATMMTDPVMTQASELMRRGVMPGKSELQKGVDILGVEVPAETVIPKLGGGQ